MEKQPIYKRPSWDEYFMNIAKMTGSRGTCDRGRSGCVIIKNKQIISTGYVGSPVGLAHCDNIGHEMHTVTHSDGSQSRHCIRTTHAEQNAICQAAKFGASLEGATLYCKMTPCYVCAKMIINVGIKRVVCEKDYHAGQRSREIFAEAGIQLNILNNEVEDYKDMTPNEEQQACQLQKENMYLNKVEPSRTNYQEKKDDQLANIFIYDEFNPEDNAMLQALYSRSPKSVEEHVEKVRQAGSGKFMEKFYVGYGHASIADCGSTTLFIEKISTLADKAIQDWPLYSGQETSTRYVDMSKQPIVDPLATFQSKAILDKWMAFYINSQEEVKKYLIGKYPQKPDEDEKIYLKAIAARAFDIMRGFLPAGITTQLSWHTNLRQAWDKLSLLRYHPLEEVQNIAEKMITGLKEKYPHSFTHKLFDEQEGYKKTISQKYNYYYPLKPTSEFTYHTNISIFELNKYHDVITSRTARTNLPHFLAELGNITFSFPLDFGSFRDIQRHRNGICRMPLLTTNLGFNEWYLDQLPENIKQQAEKLIEEQIIAIRELEATPEILQYYTAMGFNIPCKVSYGLPATVYVTELRSMKTVHPSLRKIAHQMHHALREMFPGLLLYSDLNPDDWDVRRGLQDITIKK